MIDASVLVKQAKTRLMMHHPFWAYLLCRRELEPDPNIKTARTDGTTIWYNPTFMAGKPVAEVATILAHEVGHIAFGHIQRTPMHVWTDKKLRNKYAIAADLAVNSVLMDTIKDGKSMLTMPDGAMLPSRFGLPDSLSMEEYVPLLPDPQDDGEDGDGEGDSDPGGMGGYMSPPKPNGGNQPGQGQGQQPQPQQGTAENDIDRQLKDELAGALQAAKMFGKVPMWMDRYVGKALESKIYYPEVLAAWLKESAGRDDYSWHRPNPRHMNRDLYVPSLAKIKDMVTLGIIIDTSGSIDDVTLQRFAGEINAIKGELKAEMHVIYVDTKVANTEYFAEDEDADLHAKGGGGTSFVDGFIWMNKNVDDLDAIIYLTDGCCDDFPSKDDVETPTLWCIEPNGVKGFTPPFGETLYI